MDLSPQACLSAQQLQVLETYRRSLLERRQAALQERCRRALEQAQEEGQGGCPRRDVAPVWKLRVADGRAVPGGPGGSSLVHASLSHRLPPVYGQHSLFTCLPVVTYPPHASWHVGPLFTC